MDKNQTKGSSHDESKKGKDVAEKASREKAPHEKNADRKGQTEQQKGKSNAVLGDINGDAKKGKK